MPKDQAYHSISELRSAITASLGELEQGKLSLSELEELLAYIRELEERVVVIRYRGLEKLREAKKESPPKVQENKEEYQAPELPLDETVEENAAKQISLIDSIDEIVKEGSINERMKEKSKPSLAQVLGRKPVKSISRSLNMNQKIGLATEFFKGDESGCKEMLKQVEKCNDSDEAIKLAKERINGKWDDDHELIIKLVDIIERRFL